MNKAYIYEIENQPALEASTLELVDILIYRLEITNGLEFVSPDKRKQLCEALLQPCCYVLEGV